MGLCAGKNLDAVDAYDTDEPTHRHHSVPQRKGSLPNQGLAYQKEAPPAGGTPNSGGFAPAPYGSGGLPSYGNMGVPTTQYGYGNTGGGTVYPQQQQNW